MPLSVSASPSGRTALVACTGELDVADAGALRGALRDATVRATCGVVVDLHDVSFVDSTVLGVLVDAQRALAPGRRLVLAGPRGLPLRTLQITGLDAVLDLVQPGRPLARADLDAVLSG